MKGNMQIELAVDAIEMFELRRQADVFLDLRELQPRIARDTSTVTDLLS